MITLMPEEVDTENKFKEDKFRQFAWRIKKGEIGQFTYCLENDQIYYYEDGYWRKLREKEFLALAENGLLDRNNNKSLIKFDVQRRKKVLENYKILDFKMLAEFNQFHLLNFENYMFDPIGINVLAHKPEYLSTIRIPYKYDQLASCPLWLKTIYQILEGDQLKINILQEFFGQCLTRDIKQEKSLLLLGESRSGKSTILNTLHNMVGIENASTVPLKYILNPVYTSMMIHKLINFDKDVSKKAQDFEEDFKKIVTGEEVTANDKYDDPFTFKPFCKMVLSANIFPKITDHSSAFYNRLILLPCNRVFSPSEQNRNLREELIEELPGILNWAVEGLKRLTNRGYFEEVNFMKDAINELERENNPVYGFFEDHIEIDLNGNTYIEKSDLYEKYIQWSKKNGLFTLSDIVFGKCILKKYSKETQKDSRLSSGNRPRIWKNIRYVEFKSNVIKEEISWEESPAETSVNAVHIGQSAEGAVQSKQEDINWET